MEFFITCQVALKDGEKKEVTARQLSRSPENNCASKRLNVGRKAKKRSLEMQNEAEQLQNEPVTHEDKVDNVGKG